MASKSKEENVIKLILENSPLKQWHFEEIVTEAQVTKAVANKWLKKLVREGVLRRIKEKGRFPYFTAGSNNPTYQSYKRLYALQQLQKSGLLQALTASDAKTIIIFGSIARGDWYKDSDIDIFIYGKSPQFDKNIYERILGRHIELHLFENRQKIHEVQTGLIKNIINGYRVKGDIHEIMEI